MNVSMALGWPTGGTPPMAKPVCSRTKAAGAFSSGSLRSVATRHSLTRLAPLVTTRMGRPVFAVRNTSDLAIWPTWQPTAAAASAAVRVGVSDSTTSRSRPSARSVSCTFCALALRGFDTVATLCEAVRKEKVRVGVSACLLGEPVRWDGGHKRNALLVETLGPRVQWVPVCPEMEIGLGVPRPPLHLVGSPGAPRLVVAATGEDLTARMRRFAGTRVRQLARLRLDGYVLKSGSPSCGLARVPVHGARGGPAGAGRGLFAAALAARLPLLVVEEEGRLTDPAVRESFVERLFAAARWRRLAAGRPRHPDLLAFHARHRHLLRALSPAHHAALERLIARAQPPLTRRILRAYGRLLFRALTARAGAGEV